MLELELPFNPESISRLAVPAPSPEVVAFTTLGCWGLAHLSSTLPIDGRPRLVGRELESVRLLHAIDSVARENAAVVATVAGAPGSGKTRLIEDTLVVAEAAGFEGRVFSIAAHAGDAENASIARLLSARFGLNDKSESFKRHCLLRRASELLDDDRVEDVCYFLGRILGIDFEATPLSRALSHQPLQAEMAAQTIVCELLAADARRAPLCLVIEDLQHIDRSSLATLLSLMDDLRPGMLIVGSGATEFFKRNELFAEGGTATREHIELGSLESSDVRNLLRQVVGPCQHGARAFEDYVISTALGNPGLILELVHELWAYGALQQGEHGAGCRFDSARVPDAASSPQLKVVEEVRRSSLPGLQLALLEAGALVGSTCWEGVWPLLLRVSNPELAELDPWLIASALADLAHEGHLLLLPDCSLAGEREYLFRDSEQRERLVAQVPASKCRLLHRAVADWLAAREVELAGSVDLLERLALHLSRSGSRYRAAGHYLQAARLAWHQDGPLEAAGCFERALRELGDHDNRRRIDVLHDYGVVLTELGRPTLARQAFIEMAELAKQLDLPAKHGAALNRLGRAFRDAGELGLARQALERALVAFESAGDERGVAATRDDLGKALWLLGERGLAIGLMRSALRARKRSGDELSLAVSLRNLALVWDEQGNSAGSERALGMASELSRRSADPRANCDALLVSGRLATRRHDLDGARAAFGEAMQLAYALRDRPRLARSLIALGATELRLHELDRAEELLTRGSRLALEIEAWLELAEAQRALAKLSLQRAQPARARQEVCAALRLARRSRCPSQLAATLRTCAEVVLQSGRPQAEQRAVSYHLRAIELSKRLGDERSLAKGYRALARFADRYENPEIKRQSELLRQLSDEIFDRYTPVPTQAA
jgi:tetratricopeptide (TPR) repeat protein